MRQTPIFEQMLIEDGILLRKYWFSVSDKEQLKRFRSRLNDPLRQWKLSPMDLESISRWEDYSKAKDEMMVHTDIVGEPVVRRGVGHQEARPAQHDQPPALDHPVQGRPAREGRRSRTRPSASTGYERPSRELSTYVPNHVAEAAGGPREVHLTPRANARCVAADHLRR